MDDSIQQDSAVKTYPNYFAYEIIMKKGAIDLIKRVKGWKTDDAMAQALGFTKAYIGRLKNRNAKVSENVIIRVSVALGSISDNWWIFYEIRPTSRTKTANSQCYNLEKYNGNMPYSKYSLAGKFRQECDEKVEFQKT